MAPHSSTLAWKIPWVEEPGGLQSMGLLRVGHDRVSSLSLFTFMYWRRKWQPTPLFLPGESQGQGSLVGCRLWGYTESDTTEVTQQQQQQAMREFLNSNNSPERSVPVLLNSADNNQTLQETKFFPSFPSTHVLARQSNGCKDQEELTGGAPRIPSPHANVQRLSFRISH